MSEEKVFENIDFHSSVIDDEYYKCKFVSCDFSNIQINETCFNECRFYSCNFTLAKFSQCLIDVSFLDCKVAGADFSGIRRFSRGISFVDSVLNYSIFTAVELKKLSFLNCMMDSVSFDDADIVGSKFDNCNLINSSFIGTNLENADFSTSFNFCIVPEKCKLKKTVFSENTLRGLVSHLNILIK